MASLEVDFVTYSDADFNLTQSQPFANGLATVGASPTMHMQVRTTAIDPTAWINLTMLNALTTSSMAYLSVSGGGTNVSIFIPQSILMNLPPGIYVYSIIMTLATVNGGISRTEVWRGMMTHNAGPTQFAAGTL